MQRSDWWRWPLMPIAALAAGCAAGAAAWGIFWFQMNMTGFSPTGWYYLYVTRWLVCGFFGYALTAVAYAVAPTGKVVASTVVATTVCLLGLMFVILTYMQPEMPTSSLVLVTIALPALIIGCVAGIANAD